MRPTIRATTVFAIVASCLGLLESCGGGGVTVKRYALSQCPSASFAMPKELGGNSHLVARQHDPFLCPSFRLYMSAAHAVGVRVNGGASCTLEVGYRYLNPSNDEAKGRTMDSTESDFADVVAQLLASEAGVSATRPAQSVRRFSSLNEAVDWCDSSSAPNTTSKQ